MKALILLLVLIATAHGAETCEIIEQYNETTNSIETVKVCWDKSAPDYDECDTITETVIKTRSVK